LNQEWPQRTEMETGPVASYCIATRDLRGGEPRRAESFRVSRWVSEKERFEGVRENSPRIGNVPVTEKKGGGGPKDSGN